MKLYHVTDAEFAQYGRVLDGYDFTEMFSVAENFSVPKDGIVYIASCAELENCAVAEEMRLRGFGGLGIQVGYVAGNNCRLDCLEYHKSSEFNIAKETVILVLGTVFEMQNGTFDTSLCKCFLIPAGTGVELYGTTLHYAPFSTDENGYRVLCVLPKGTNAEKQPVEARGDEDLLCGGVNKWLMTHPEAAPENQGVHIGLYGKNIAISDIQE